MEGGLQSRSILMYAYIMNSSLRQGIWGFQSLLWRRSALQLARLQNNIELISLGILLLCPYGYIRLENGNTQGKFFCRQTIIMSFKIYIDRLHTCQPCLTENMLHVDRTLIIDNVPTCHPDAYRAKY